MVLWYLLSWVLDTGSGSGCANLGAGVGIEEIGFGMGRVISGFLLIPALPCPILGLGIGGTASVGSIWSVVCV